MTNKLLINAAAMIENDDLRELYFAILADMPDYIGEVPGSSSGKYHPIQDLGEGGLCRHMWCVGQLIDWKLSLAYYREKYDSRKRDCMRIAGLVHDGRKSGEENGGHTVHEHPILMRNAVINLGKEKFPQLTVDVLRIAFMISSHMGQWNTSKYSEAVLPLPTTEMQMIVHEADYIASRKECTLTIPGFEE